MKRIVISLVICVFVSACDRMLLGGEDKLMTAYENLQAPPALGDGIEVSSLTKVNMDSVRIYTLIKALQEKSKHHIRSILIARHNKLVLESYFNGWKRERMQDMRSATKSITSALMGIAIDKQMVPSVNVPVFNFFNNEYKTFAHWEDIKSEITIKDFLRMRTGLRCNDWVPASEGNEEKMYKKRDWVKFVLDLPVDGRPGENYSYCTGAPVTLGAIISNASGRKIPDFAHQYLFEPLGIKEYSWEFMPNGRADTGGHLHLKPRDMLKFGLLFMNQGTWNGEQLISPSWINESTKADGEVPTSNGLQYGYLWWCKKWVHNNQDVKAYFASGNGGQFIFVLPELDIVVVFTGGGYNTNMISIALSIMEGTIIRAVND